VYLDGTLRSDELHAWELAVNAARAREIDALIQEIPSVLASRLPQGAIQMAVITSICGSDQSCRRDSSTERELGAIAKVLGAVSPHGMVIANADDLLVVDALERFNHSAIYYALHEGNPVLRAHLDAGGSACWIDDGWIVYRDGERSAALAPVCRVGPTIEGNLSYQVQNVLAATAAALATGIEPDAVAACLTASTSVPHRHPGTTNRIERGGGQIIIDRPKSVWALKQLMRSVRATTARRILVVVGGLPRLSPDETTDAARVIAAPGGVVFMHGTNGSAERRERILTGLASATAPPVTFHLESERAAINRVLEMLQPGDTAIILADDARLSVELVAPVPGSHG
jgi:cyanophycin synthetase